MARYKLSELAEEDLRLISAKTIEKYVSLLHETMIQIATTPTLGRNRPELFEKARSFPAQQHIVYYWQTEAGIEVARILHQRMDVLIAFE